MREKRYTREQIFNALTFVFTDVFEKRKGDFVERLRDEVLGQLEMDRELKKIFNADWMKK